MGLFTRFSTIMRANANNMVSQLEDPQKLLDQSLADMAYQYSQARQQITAAIVDEKRFRRQWEGELKQALSWKSRAQLAVRAGDDELAKHALMRKKEHAEIAEEFQKQWENQKAAVDQLKTLLQGLGNKIEQAKRKRYLLIAKQKRAQAQITINQTVAALSSSSALGQFQGLEEAINRMEAEAEAAMEMHEQLTGDDLSYRFAQLEATQGVDMDLLELKAQMGVLPAATSTNEHLRLISNGGQASLEEHEEMDLMLEQPPLRRAVAG